MFDSENDQKLWVESIFTNSFWNLLSEIKKNNAARNRIMFITVQFIEKTDHITVEDLTEARGAEIAAIFLIVRKVMCGIHGLAKPRPGSATLEQVKYVFPQNYTAGRDQELCHDLARTGRSLIMALRRDSSGSKIVWQDVFD